MDPIFTDTERHWRMILPEAIGPLPSPSPCSPLTIPDLEFWLDATQETALVTGNPASVAHDFSGNARDALQATPINQPIFIENLVGPGLHGFTFNGVQQFLEAANGSFDLIGKEDYAVFAVFCIQNPSNGKYVFGNTDVTFNPWIALRPYIPGIRYEYSNKSVADTVNDYQNCSGVEIVSVIDNIAQTEIYQDGVLRAVNTDRITIDPVAGTTIGAFFDGTTQIGFLEFYLCELLVFSNKPDGTDLICLNEYFEDKYASASCCVFPTPSPSPSPILIPSFSPLTSPIPSPSPVPSPSPCIPLVDEPTKYYCVTKVIYSDTDCTVVSSVLSGICVLGQTIIDETPLVEPCNCFGKESPGTSVYYAVHWGPFDDAVSCSFFCGSLSSIVPSPGHNSDEYESCVSPSPSPAP